MARVAVALGVLLPPGYGVAGNISIQLTPQPHVRDGVLAVELQVRNAGDEPARSVSPMLGFRGQMVRGDVTPALRPGQTLDSTLEIPAAGLGPGRWPYRIAVDYADANEYPFHALHVGTVEVLVGKGAHLTFVELQSLGQNVWNFTHERVRVNRNAKVDWIFSAVGSRLTTSKLLGVVRDDPRTREEFLELVRNGDH